MPQPAPQEHALVVGGGIAGLSAALALQRCGADVTVFERAATVRELGAGVVLSSAGMTALSQLGVADDVADVAAPVEAHVVRSRTGRTLQVLPLGVIARRHGLPAPVAVARGDLLAALAAHLGRSHIRVDSEVVDVVQNEAGVTVTLATGERKQGTILVGADGLHSTVRRQLHPTAAPRYLGYQSLRALVDCTELEVPVAQHELTYGRGDRFGVTRCGRGRAWWFGVITAPEGTIDDQRGRRAELLDRFGRFHTRVPTIIASTPEEAILRHDVHDIDPLTRWCDHRLVLVGDAAHAASVAGGQGVSQALLDAAILGRTVAASSTDCGGGEPLVTALEQFDRHRRPAVTALQTSARRTGEIISWRHPVACAYRNLRMRTWQQRQAVRRLDRHLATVARDRTRTPCCKRDT